MLVHKNSNLEMPCGKVPVLLNSGVCKNGKPRDASFVEFPVLQNQQTQRCHVVKFQFSVEFPVFAESANPEMLCGEVPVLLNF